MGLLDCMWLSVKVGLNGMGYGRNEVKRSSILSA